MDRTYSGDHLLRSTGGSASTVVDSKAVAMADTATPRANARPSLELVIGSSRFSQPPCAEAGGFLRLTAGTACFFLCIPPIASHVLRTRIACQPSWIIHCLTRAECDTRLRG